MNTLLDFHTWLLIEAQRPVDQAVLDSYDRAFAERLEGLIARTTDPQLRKTFERMRTCPIRDGKGNCYGWSSYIVKALLRSGCRNRLDLEPALSHVVWLLLSSVTEKGGKRKGVFDFVQDRPVPPGANPVEALFKTYIKNFLKNLTRGKMPRLERTQRLKSPTVPAENAPARSGGQEREMINDLFSLIARKNSTLPLIDIFQGMIDGETSRQQRERFGRQADRGRSIIRQIVVDYAHSSGNRQLLRLLEPSSRERVGTTGKPALSPEIADFLSIIDVIQKSGGSTIAELGSKRRRWLDLPPRTSSSPHRNRLYDTLAKMVEDRVLIKQNGKYVPGPRFEEFADLRDQVTGRRLSM